MAKQLPQPQSSSAQAGFAQAHLPPLESRDCLTRPEFERRYAAADIKKAELIGLKHTKNL